ncbi:metallo beta lactamase superfamily protein [Rhodococcus opacus M213]|uniref:Metallo beta lactamase superfamily protein n=1 Tax=Rhodococcus opacus M213 TaxID=1129896 RepID=K8X9V0_RHOOP|nr:MBL fold metallo-hydrolase [Rhodococcus opacus]EKT78303.1 metallo beta lactamase superfamily protein [Rhodococcus opacus M213]
MTDITDAGTPPVRATTYVGRWPEIPAREAPGTPDGTFSPTTSVLISGPTEVVLIDAQYLEDDVRELGDLIERTGKTLTTIYVTHAHADHYAGAETLLERFPTARYVALPNVAQAIHDTLEVQQSQWDLLFGDACVSFSAIPESLHETTLYVDGTPIEIIEIEQADISPTSIVHVPDIGVVVAGDAIYNEIHPMLGLSTPDEWQAWQRAIDVVEGLNPRSVIAGHRRPDGDDHAVEEMIAQTRAYLADFSATYHEAENVEDFVQTIATKYPHHGNLWTLLFSANSALEHREKMSADRATSK